MFFKIDKRRREAFGVRRIPALYGSSALRESKAPEYGALQTLRAVRLPLGFASVVWLITFCLSVAVCCRAEEPTQREYELKAAVLYHIIEYVEWPSEVLSGQPTLQLGLLGDIPFAAAIELLDGKTVQGRKLVVKRISAADEAARCQVLFIGASEKSRLGKIVEDVKNRPVLTVSEVEGFAEKSGGMVNLVTGPNRIIMEINRQATGQAKLSLSSQLLRLAKVYPR